MMRRFTLTVKVKRGGKNNQAVGNTLFRAERTAIRLKTGFRKKDHLVHKRKLMAEQLNSMRLPPVSRRERNLNKSGLLRFQKPG